MVSPLVCWIRVSTIAEITVVFPKIIVRSEDKITDENPDQIQVDQ